MTFNENEAVFVANLMLVAIASMSLWIGWPRHHRDPGEGSLTGFGSGILFASIVVSLARILTS